MIGLFNPNKVIVLKALKATHSQPLPLKSRNAVELKNEYDWRSKQAVLWRHLVAVNILPLHQGFLIQSLE